MKQITVHFNQLVTPENQLHDGAGLYIDLKYSKEKPDEVLAHKAMCYSINEEEEVTEEEWSVNDAMNEWASYINSDAHGLDGILAVLCPDKIWRKVFWFDDYKVGRAFTTKG